MSTDRHAGRSSPVFVIEGHPDKFNGILQRHGVLCRVQRARRCPCGGRSGSPSMFCNQCHGDGFVYDYQRKFLQQDEDSDVSFDGLNVLPFRVPILQPVRVERLIAPEQGDIREYKVVSFTDTAIGISGDDLPKPWMKMRVSYYFDRYNKAIGDQVSVDPLTRVITTTATRFSDGHRTGNALNLHGDITEIIRVYNSVTGYVYREVSFRRNQIYLSGAEPEPVDGQIKADYYYAEPTRILPADMDTSEDKEKWTSQLSSGTLRLAVEPWYEISQGDLITFLSSMFWRDEIVSHSSNGYDLLTEFDVGMLDDYIFDEDGIRYQQGRDFYLRRFREIAWLKRQPEPQKLINVRYGYHPTVIIFQNNAVPNVIENKPYPQIVYAKMWNKKLKKDIEQSELAPIPPQANSQAASDFAGPTFILPGSSIISEE